MLAGAQALLERTRYGREIAGDHRLRVKPQARKDGAVVNAARGRDEAIVVALAQDEVIDLAVVNAPDDVLAHAVAAIDIELVVQIVACGTSCDLGDQFRRTGYVAFCVDARLPGTRRVDQQVCIGVRFFFETEAQGAVVTTLHPWSRGSVQAKP